MRVIKLALISIVFLFVVVTAISLLIPSHVRISKAINIAGEKEQVFALIRDTSQWKLWYPAFMPNEQSTNFPEVNVQMRNENDSLIEMALQQSNKPEVINGWNLFEHGAADSLTLQWYMDFHMKWYPWRKFASLFFENTYGVMMQQGLENIRSIVQREPEIREEDQP